MQGQLENLRERYRYLQSKYHELCALFTLWRERHYLVKCAWCQQRIGWKRKPPSVPVETSHGICRPCASRVLTHL